jgi:hypothetical protein
MHARIESVLNGARPAPTSAAISTSILCGSWGATPVLTPRPGFLIGMREDAFSRCGEEFTHLVLLQAAHPNEHDRVPDVVIRQVEGLRIVFYQRGTLLIVRPDHQRSWFR